MSNLKALAEAWLGDIHARVASYARARDGLAEHHAREVESLAKLLEDVRADALEEAAGVVDRADVDTWGLAHLIRALAEEETGR